MAPQIGNESLLFRWVKRKTRRFSALVNYRIAKSCYVFCCVETETCNWCVNESQSQRANEVNERTVNARVRLIQSISLHRKSFAFIRETTRQQRKNIFQFRWKLFRSNQESSVHRFLSFLFDSFCRSRRSISNDHRGHSEQPFLFYCFSFSFGFYCSSIPKWEISSPWNDRREHFGLSSHQ